VITLIERSQQPVSISCINKQGEVSTRLCLLDIALEIDQTSVEAFLSVFRLRCLRRERELHFSLLLTSTAKFLSTHVELQKLRDKLMGERGLTRNERKGLVRKTAEVEGEAMKIKVAVESVLIVFYQLSIEEVNSCVSLSPYIVCIRLYSKLLV